MKSVECPSQELQWFKRKVQMVSKVARNRFGSREKRHFCCNGVGSWSMAPTKVLNCSHDQSLSFEHSQCEQLAKGCALREFTPSGSLTKSSFIKKNFVLHPSDYCEAHGILSDDQCGFRSERSTVDIRFVVRRLQELARRRRIPLYMCFVDLQ